MATKWIGHIRCRWWGAEARIGIEKDGLGRTYRVMYRFCGISEQAGFSCLAGQTVESEIGRVAPDPLSRFLVGPQP